MKDIINRVLIFFLLWGMATCAFGQTEGEFNLKEGDKMSQEIVELLERNGGEIGKPTIINFWASWCVPCVRELKLLDSILNETNKLNVLSVTYEDEEKVASFLNRQEDLQKSSLHILSSDTLLKNYFPHRILPHNIWIDKEGVIQHITGGEEMKRENLLSFADQKSIEVHSKNDNILFDPVAPFHLSDSEFVYRSILTKRIDGILSGETVKGRGYGDKRVISRVFTYNATINNMLWLAVNKGVSPNDFFNIMRIETNDSSRFFSPSQAPLTFKESKYESNQEWKMENTHCYELRMPEYINADIFYSYMLEDLKRNFSFDVEIMEDSIMCSVITAENRDVSSYDSKDTSIFILTKNEIRVENVSMLSLFQSLNERLKNNPNDIPEDPPFIDRTEGMRISFNLNFKEGLPKYEDIKKLIEEKYGIKILHQREKYPITIIKDMR